MSRLWISLRARCGTQALAWLAVLLAAPALHAEGVPSGTPLASVDLASHDGASLLGAEWRYSDTQLVQVAFHDPGSDGQPTGRDTQTYDFVPKAGARDFDDSHWMRLDPGSLSKPRGHGHLSFNWYRVRLTVPARIGSVDHAR
jgi:hypothetical protein